MKRVLAMLAVLLLALPVLAEENDVQAEANAAYAAVILEGAEAVHAARDAELAEGLTGYDPVFTLQQTPVQFTVLDLNGDGVNDVVLEVSDVEGFILLIWQDGKVCAVNMPYRGLLSLKDDGTHNYSSGAADGGVRTIGVDWLDDVPVWNGFVQAAMIPGADGGLDHIEVDGVPVDEAAYDAFIATQEAKLDALWYACTPENVRMLLGQ